jgi:uncharacterized membrane protein
MSKELTSNSANNKQRWIIGVLSLIGLGIMVYLTYIHFANAQSFCDISESISCDVVTTGIYSEIFGLPVSILGLGFFALVLALMIFNKKENVFQTVFLLTLFVLLPSLYLTSLELLVIKSWCILCETSKVIMILVLIASGIEAHKRSKITSRLVAPIIIAGLIAVFVTFFAQTGNTTREDYTEFVECLNTQGVVYYKSVTCSNCKRQEKLLGVAYEKLNSVECHPDGPDGNPGLCLSMGIDKTPTFLIEKDGQEIDRKEGLTPLEALGEFAGCPFE